MAGGLLVEAWLPDRIPARVDYESTIAAYAGPLDGHCVERTMSKMMGPLPPASGT